MRDKHSHGVTQTSEVNAGRTDFHNRFAVQSLKVVP